jgi:hypothetical protein
MFSITAPLLTYNIHQWPDVFGHCLDKEAAEFRRLSVALEPLVE